MTRTPRNFGLEVDFEDTRGDAFTLQSTNAQSVARLRPGFASVPMELLEGWNRVDLDLRYLASALFKRTYRRCLRVRIFANCRLRRVFFSDRVRCVSSSSTL